MEKTGGFGTFGFWLYLFIYSQNCEVNQSFAKTNDYYLLKQKNTKTKRIETDWRFPKKYILKLNLKKMENIKTTVLIVLKKGKL